MTYPPPVLATYRGRDQMDLLEFIADVEATHFRTNQDTGANPNALFIWNIVRNWAGLDCLDHDDLSQRHADDRGISLEKQKAEEAAMKRIQRHVQNGMTYAQAFEAEGFR